MQVVQVAPAKVAADQQGTPIIDKDAERGLAAVAKEEEGGHDVSCKVVQAAPAKVAVDQQGTPVINNELERGLAAAAQEEEGGRDVSSKVIPDDESQNCDMSSSGKKSKQHRRGGNR